MSADIQVMCQSVVWKYTGDCQVYKWQKQTGDRKVCVWYKKLYYNFLLSGILAQITIFTIHTQKWILRKGLLGYTIIIMICCDMLAHAVDTLTVEATVV